MRKGKIIKKIENLFDENQNINFKAYCHMRVPILPF